ncbi:hypothetical protein FZD47_21070 [Bacillus infantis]|uniref:Bacterial Ig-like domain-containing protein n=1 Tax=Bacillus infantis TaxID=324767 RepID=A0A5D4SFC8_9BACI|nr:hypothetical protein [Bacillus infantis]TYS60702.1 hypothetical protein FZD47_21070 [Bacillus infantis]
MSKGLNKTAVKVAVASTAAVGIGVTGILDVFLPGEEKVYAATQDIRSVPAGTVITFANQEWVVLNPATGFILAKTPIKENGTVLSRSLVEGTNESSRNYYVFNPNAANNLGFYLNNTYLNGQFSTDEKAAIQSTQWGIGNEQNEASSFATAKIAVMSYSEYLTYKNLAVPAIEASRYTMLRTPYSGAPTPYWVNNPPSNPSQTHAWVAEGSAWSVDKISANWGYTSFYVHPVLYLNPSTKVSGNKVIFVEAPTVAPALTPSATTLTNGNVQVTMTDPANTEAISKREYRINGGAWTAYTGPVVMTANGSIEGGVSNAGGDSPIRTLLISNIDKVAPAKATFSPSTTNPTNQDVSVSIVFPDDAAVKQFKVGASGEWKAYTTPLVLSKNETIFARSQDAAGNWSEESNIVIQNIDKTPPDKPTIQSDKSEATNANVLVSISYPNDAAVKQFRVNGGDWQAYSNAVTVSENSVVEARAVDAAGNISENAVYEVSNIDKEKPVITLTPSRVDPVNVEINVDVDVVDQNAIVSKKWAKGDQPESFFETSGTDIVGESFIVGENGTYTVYAKDAASNVSIKTIIISNIDMEAPVITATPSKIEPVNTEIDVDVDVTDNVSVAEVKWGAHHCLIHSRLILRSRISSFGKEMYSKYRSLFLCD